MRIALDIDGVICDYLGSYLQYMNGELGTRLGVKDIKGWNFYRDHNIPEEKYREVANSFIYTGGMAGLGIIPGAAEHVSWLVKNYPVIFITHRPETSRADTLAWFAKHIPAALDCPFELTYTKGDAAKAFEATHFLDDSMENLLEVWASGTTNVCLFTCHHNKAEQIYKFPRAHTWEDVFKIWGLEELRK